MPKLYALHQTLFSFSGDAWIEDDAGNRVFEVDGKAFAIGRTLDLLDHARDGALHAPAAAHVVRPTFEISREGALVATIQKALFAFFGDRFTVDPGRRDALEASGDFLDHEFVVARDGVTVLEASRAWFTVHGTYGVQVADAFDDPLALAIVIAIEQLEAQEDRRAAAVSSPL